MTSGTKSGAQGTKARSGEDTQARFAELYRKEKPRLLRYFQRKLGNRSDADDMAQETMARYFRAAPKDQLVTPQAYLTRIATNMLQDRAERGSTRLALHSTTLDEGLTASDGIDPHRDLAARQELARWRAILAQLPRDTLDIFSLNRIEGYSYREIAADKNLPLWVVQKHMLKAIRHIAANQDESHD
ncbi:RNA polymerase sigma factor [Sphingobium yanoikuyae]|uniref:RNA polymerase subunit sigma-70 n=1 Tax=Sphingobium yanoikuyae TaxID=13690 RepID=A0A291N0V8_SPHYA|nr:RNA polymerase sigma factor [Sphingobium yanoikuyae]ATI80835.1 RNA polymerase subunit sigma-70 [Sphingobium yanoikuyae]